jgi:hypothetical protein
MMLGSTPITAVLGCGVDSTDHDAMRAFVRAACGEGLSLLLVWPGSKEPADMRTPRQKSADNRAAQQAAKDAGRRDWEHVKSPSGLALASSDAKVVLKYLDRYVEQFSTWVETDDDGSPKQTGHRVPFDAKRAKAGQIVLAEPVAVNLAVEVGGSGLVVVDCDTREQLERFLEVSEAPPDMPPTVRSPGQQTAEGVWAHKDGGHFWFTVDDDVRQILPRNSGAMTWGGDHGFAILWDRRYVLIPPSRRPEGAYELTGRDYPVPNWLTLAICEHGDAREARYLANRQQGDADDALSESIDKWAESIGWSDILEPLGWAPAPRSDGCGCDVWTAPGLHASPKSATAHDSGCSLGRYTEVNCPLHIWTDNPGEPFDRWLAEEKTQTISKLQAVALVDYGGNVGKAMDALGLAPDLGVGADFGVGPAKAIDASDGDVSMANLRDQEIELPDPAALGQSITVTEADIARENPFDVAAAARAALEQQTVAAAQAADNAEIRAVAEQPAAGTVTFSGPGGDHTRPYNADAADMHDAYTAAVSAPEDEPASDPFDMAGTVPQRKTAPERADAVSKDNDNPFADKVSAPDPDVFDCGITGVPRIAPFSHWRDLPPPEYIIDGLIEHGGLSCIIGPPNAGKSTVALDMACHIATGRRWQGRQTLMTKVLYMPGEGLSGAIQRLIAWCDARGIDENDVSANLLLSDAILQLGASNEAWAEFGAYVARQGVGLIIFDTFARMSLRLEENSATDVGLAVARFDRVRQLTNAGVMVIHHTAKGQDFGRGSSALNGAMDSELLVKHGQWDYGDMVGPDNRLPGTPIELSTTKQKNSQLLDDPIPMMIMPHPLPDSDDTTAALITGPGGKIDPLAGDVVHARPTAEPLVETAIRIREFVDGLTMQGASRSELVIGVRPDAYALSRKDAGAYWKLQIGHAVDRALKYQLIETLTGTPSGGRYVPCSEGTPEDARQRAAAEVINQDGD